MTSNTPATWQRTTWTTWNDYCKGKLHTNVCCSLNKNTRIIFENYTQGAHHSWKTSYYTFPLLRNAMGSNPDCRNSAMVAKSRTVHPKSTGFCNWRRSPVQQLSAWVLAITLLFCWWYLRGRWHSSIVPVRRNLCVRQRRRGIYIIFCAKLAVLNANSISAKRF